MDQGQFFKLIGEKIRKLRIERGYPSYEHFAFDNELPRHNVLRAECGKPISGKTLHSIITALKISPEEFFKGIK